MDWRLLIDPPAGGARNMAVDEALLESVKAGGRPVLRLYRWDPPCLSLGRNQPGRGRYDPSEAERRGVHIVRRPTGGMAVYHDAEQTYAVIAPVSVIGRPRDAYAAVNRALVASLKRLGVAAGLAAEDGNGRGPLATTPCFDAPAAGEVVAAGRKLVGSAQRCEGRTILQHGSLLLSGSQHMVELLQGRERRSAATGWVTVEELVPRAPSAPELAEAIRAGFGESLGARLVPDGLTTQEEARVGRLAARHASADWVWRR